MSVTRHAVLPLLALALGAGLPRPAAAQAPLTLPLLSYDPVQGYYDPVTGYVFGQGTPATSTILGTLLPGILFTDSAGDTISTLSNETSLILSTPVETTNVDTPASVTDHTFSTTVDALLGGGSVFSRTFALPFSDPSVQAAVTQADALLAADGAAFGAPALASSLLTNLGSTTTTVPTGQSSVAFAPVTTAYVGPAIIPIFKGGSQPDHYHYVFFGGIAFDTVSDTQLTVSRAVTTTTTDLLTQRYAITGTPRLAPAVPEPGPLALLASGLLLGLLPVGLSARRRNRALDASVRR